MNSESLAATYAMQDTRLLVPELLDQGIDVDPEELYQMKYFEHLDNLKDEQKRWTYGEALRHYTEEQSRSYWKDYFDKNLERHRGG